MDVELLTQHGSKVYAPCVQSGIQWTTERYGSPGKLTFKVLNDNTYHVSEGDPVRLKVDGDNVFFGFVFTIKCNSSNEISITAYDQLRYLKNKETYTYSGTATKLIKMIAKDFQLQCGSIDNTEFNIPSRVEDGQTLFDIIQNALDETLKNTGNLYVLYDNFGKLSLKFIGDMTVNIMIDKDTAQSYDYSSSIDDKTYNQVKLYYDNDETGKRETYLTQDSKSINKWGLLRFYEKLNEGENGKSKADALLGLYNSPTKTFSVKGAFGDNRVRGGSMIVVQMQLKDLKIQNYMLVESCTHKYENGEHWMDLKLRGGEINNA